MLTAPLLAATGVLLLVAGSRGVALRVGAGRVRRRLPGPANVGGPPARFVAALADADLAVEPARAWLACVGAVVAAAGVGLVTGGAAAAAVLAAGAAVVPAAALHALRHRADARAVAALPATLELLARSLRAGASLRDALADAASAGRLGDDLRAVLGEAAAGVPLATALDGWAVRRPAPGVRLAVAALALGAESGGATARAVDGVAATLRAHDAVAAEARALAAQARTSALVIALAPVAFTVLLAGADPRTVDFLLRTPVGLACLAGGLGLDAVAALWMHRLTAVAP